AFERPTPRGDGGGVQGDLQAKAVWFGDEVDEGRSGGRAEPAVANLHPGGVAAVLGEGGPSGLPGRRLITHCLHHSSIESDAWRPRKSKSPRCAPAHGSRGREGLFVEAVVSASERPGGNQRSSRRQYRRRSPT